MGLASALGGTLDDPLNELRSIKDDLVDHFGADKIAMFVFICFFLLILAYKQMTGG